MAVATTLLVAALALLIKLVREPQADTATAQQMQEREACLRQEVTRLQRELEWNRSLQEVSFLSELQLYFFWAAAAVMLLEICWLAWQINFVPCNRHVQDSSDCEEFKGPCHSVRLFSVPKVLSMQELSHMCREVKKMVHDILHVCQILSKDTFMPELHPATANNSIHESWNIFENRILYQLLVFLQPPPRHSFRQELCGGTHLPVRSHIRVVLECTCRKNKGNIPCFLHSKTCEIAQSSPLLQTLCTGSYLDVEEIACWVQNSVQTAWEHLPQWQDWKLTVLPSSHSCRMLLTGPSEVQLCAVLVFAVEQGFPGTFVILQ